MRKSLIIMLISLFPQVGTGLFAQNKIAPNVATTLHNTNATRTISNDQSSKLYQAFITINPTCDRDNLESLGVIINQDLGDILTVEMPLSAIEQLEEIEDIIYVELATRTYQQLDLAREAAKVDDIHTAKELTQAYTGKGVIIGIVDNGFDYTHPNFKDANGDLRIIKVWEQNSQGISPKGYSYGAEYSTTEDILAATSDMSVVSHGTHVAGIATGAYGFDDKSKSNYYGVAPNADIILVSKKSGDPTNVSIADAIAYIFDYAESVNKPCVINLSIGAQIGPHDGTSTFDRLTDRLQGNGKLLIGASGNFGNSPLHISKKFDNINDTLRTCINFKETPTTTNKGGEFDIWGSEGCNFAVQMSIISTRDGSIVDSSATISTTKTETMSYEIGRNGTGTITLSSEINPINNKPHIYASLEVTNIRARYALTLTITNLATGEVHAWADDSYILFTDNSLEGYTNGDKLYTLAEIGGTGKNILSVGSYNTRTTYKTISTPQEMETGEKLGEVSTFSSIGPSIDNRRKPDVYAPGSYIISSVNSTDISLSTMPLAMNFTYGEGHYSYGYMQGTSMATPFVTGVVATWLEANPKLGPNEIREIIDETSNTITPQASDPSNPQLSINAIEGIKYALQMEVSVDVDNTSNEEIIWFCSDKTLYLNKDCNDLCIYDLMGKLVFRTSNKSVINLSHLSQAIYIMKIDNKVEKFILE